MYFPFAKHKLYAIMRKAGRKRLEVAQLADGYLYVTDSRVLVRLRVEGTDDLDTDGFLPLDAVRYAEQTKQTRVELYGHRARFGIEAGFPNTDAASFERPS